MRAASSTWRHFARRIDCFLESQERVNAFAIAGKLGLPDYIIEEAKTHLTEQDESFEDLLTDLESSRRTIAKEQEEIAAYRRELEALKQETAQKKENIVGGIVGALLGSLLGMLSVLILSQLGYVAALSGVIMAVCVLKGYEMLGGKLTKKAVVISAVIMILMTYFADRVDWAIILFNQGGGAEAGYSLFECYRLIPAALSAEIIDMGSYIGNLVLQYLFVALGAIPTVIGKMKQKKEEGIIARLN